MATKKTPIADAARGFTKPIGSSKPSPIRKAPAKTDKAVDSKAIAKDFIEKRETAKRSDPSLPGVPVVKVRTLGDLRKAILEFPVSNTFTTDQKFGTDLIHIQNIRGRTVAQIQVEKKAKTTARADKL